MYLPHAPYHQISDGTFIIHIMEHLYCHYIKGIISVSCLLLNDKDYKKKKAGSAQNTTSVG